MCSPEVMSRVHAALRSGRARAVSRRGLLAGAAATAAMVPLAGIAGQASPVASPVTGERTIVFSTVSNLSYANSPATPVWPGNTSFTMETVVTIEENGFYANVLTHHEHTGTHMDAPAHFFVDGATADLVDSRHLVAPLAVIDVTAQAEANVDYGLAVDDILAWEAEHGILPDGAFVAMNSGWGARIDDAEAFVNLDADGVMHFPGFSPEASAFLIEERSIVGIGSDTLSQDPGNSTDFGTHITILGAGKYGVEGLANIGDVPPGGATVVLGAANHELGSGGPTRILALH